MTQPIAFILGGGLRIGHAVAAKFVSQGYSVALGRRSIQASVGIKGVTPVAVDVASMQSVEAAFAEVEIKLGFPTVVVYNGEAPSMSPLLVPPEAFANDTAINVTGGYAALYAATRGWERLREGGSATHKHQGVFIATGNVTPFYPNPIATSLAAGKAALVHLIELAEQEFYFVSQILDDGGPVPYDLVKGGAHAEAYWEIVQGKVGKDTWDVRFVVGNDGSIKYGMGR
ncbi:epimerase/hydratase [Penicillium lagena]|uniref:epimerase/hydratase n=1 Tax=Penicillium lagena TaxID=94218 RepID=UPI002541414F|nr:epimerase/hydratase [Penicillium lagena]KAJ5618867.1 epimerase/hydratase [Penicillium lagena]